MLHSGLMSILKSQIIFWKRNEKWGIFSFKKPSISTLEENSVYCNYVCTCTHTLFIAIISIFCPMSSMCPMQSVTTEKLLSIAFWIIKKTLLVVLCSKLLQNLASKDAGILFLIRFLCCHYPKIWKMTFRQPCLQCNIMLREREEFHLLRQ